MAKTYRFDDDTLSRLDRLKNLTGQTNETALLRDAIRYFEEAQHQHEVIFMGIFNQLSAALGRLEITRDYGREGVEMDGDGIGDLDRNFLTDDERKVYEFYGRMWDEMQKMPFYSVWKVDE